MWVFKSGCKFEQWIVSFSPSCEDHVMHCYPGPSARRSCWLSLTRLGGKQKSNWKIHAAGVWLAPHQHSLHEFLRKCYIPLIYLIYLCNEYSMLYGSKDSKDKENKMNYNKQECVMVIYASIATTIWTHSFSCLMRHDRRQVFLVWGGEANCYYTSCISSCVLCAMCYILHIEMAKICF